MEGCAQGIIINSRMAWHYYRTCIGKCSPGTSRGFYRSLDQNISLIRRRINTPMLKFQYLYLGEQTQTKVAITYIEGVASPAIVQEVLAALMKSRLMGL